MPYFLTGFLQQHQGVELTMDVTNKAKVIKSLENNEVDFALVSVLPEKLNVEEEVLLENKLYLIGNRDQSFPNASYPKTIFNELPLIFREAGSGTRFVMESFFEKSNIRAEKKMELTSNEAVKQAVMAGLGFSVMPLIGVHTELLAGNLQIIPVAGLPVTSTWRLIWLKSKTLSPVAQAFLNDVKSRKQEVLEKSFSWMQEFQ